MIVFLKWEDGMKNKLFIALSLLAIFSLMLSGAASYKQTPERPERQPGTEQNGPAMRRPPAEISDLLQKKPPRAMEGRLADSLRPQAPSTVTPGATGLSFSFDSIIGVTQHGYPSDTDHLNAPDGLFMDGSGNLYVVENRGARVLRYDSSGNNTLELGQASYHDTREDTFSWPDDVTVDASGNIWVVDDNRVTRRDSAGNFEMSFPVIDNQPWQCRDDNEGFCNPDGIAIDSGGFLYVSDGDNYRVQVFTISGGTPVYSTTIGETGVTGNDNDHFAYPAHIATYGTGTVFVADADNARVQKCTYGPPWSCTTFYDDLNYPWGITVDSSGNVYIVDNGDGLVKQCDPTGTVCATVVDENDGLVDPNDVVVDAGGNLYISEWARYRVSKYSGGSLSTFVGTTLAPYVPDTAHIYSPFGIAVDSLGNLYVGERYGFRWLKYDSSGNQLLAKGEAGISGNDADHFGDNIMGSPAFNASNFLYVPAGNRHCVRVYDQNYTYLATTLGTCGARGDDGSHFWAVAGVAISPLDGKIYVVDRNNNKVKIFSSINVYLNTLGAGNPIGYGNGDYQFDNPSDVAIDKNGTIYVADRNNQRVQVYNSSGVYQRSIGYTGDCDWDFDHLCGPHGVGVDALDRLYIADTWNNRVLVFDSNGAYLTTLSGSWGSGPSDMNAPVDVAVDKAYNVYVTDMNDHRISKFALGVPDWQQVNLNGFTDIYNNRITALDSFNGYLYAGTDNTNTGSQIWSQNNGTNWNKVAPDGFGKLANRAIDDLVEFKGNLYAATWSNTTNGGEIWRSSNPGLLTWTDVITSGFGNTNNTDVVKLTVFSNTLYAATWSSVTTHGTEVWRSSSGNKGSWTNVVPNGWGDPINEGVNASAIYSGSLYMGTENYDSELDTTNGAQIWRTTDGENWDPVTVNGFNDPMNVGVSALEPFGNYLYAVAYSYNYSVEGNQIWRCHKCDGTDWYQIMDNGWGVSARQGSTALKSLGNWLYLAIPNYDSDGGIEVWRTQDGLTWAQVGFAGFGDNNNDQTYVSNSVTVMDRHLYIGVRNIANGGEIWTLLPKLVYLPLVRR
jgi:hypothetical protein